MARFGIRIIGTDDFVDIRTLDAKKKTDENLSFFIYLKLLETT